MKKNQYEEFMKEKAANEITAEEAKKMGEQFLRDVESGVRDKEMDEFIQNMKAKLRKRW